MSFENAPQSYCGAFSKGGKGADAIRRKIPEKTLLGEKRFLRKATEKKEQKIKPENHAPRQRGVIALAVSGEIFVKRVFQGSGFRRDLFYFV
ncbi:MAG: hypothetical protein V1763_00995, partial [Parcubacteria group bacterium]